MFYFRQVINSDNPVIVNFHAEWCDPCKLNTSCSLNHNQVLLCTNSHEIRFCFFPISGKILTPKMTELLEPMDDIDLAVVDVDSNIDLVNTFEVKAVPAVLAFRNGVVVDKFIGLVDSTMIENLISKLKKKKET